MAGGEVDVEGLAIRVWVASRSACLLGHPGDLEATIGKQAGEGARAAADIQHATGPEFGCDRQLVMEIVTLFLHKVVDLGEPREGQKGISHKSNLT